MAEAPAQTPVPAPAQNPQVVQSGGGGMDWKKIITVVVIIIAVTAIISTPIFNIPESGSPKSHK